MSTAERIVSTNRPVPRWTVADLVVASVLAVVGGIVFSIFNATYLPLSEALQFYPPLTGLYLGIWLFPGVLGALIIRKPGAAIYTELVAAVISAFVGSAWGISVIWYGLFEGLGAEIVFAVLLYRRFGLPVAGLAGAGAGVAAATMDLITYYPAFPIGQKLAYLVTVVLSGILIAGIGSWVLARSLARTGVLAPLASGRDAERI